MINLQPVITQQQREATEVGTIQIVAETGTDTIEKAVQSALEDVKVSNHTSNLTFAYRKEILARSYMLDTIRAIHHVEFLGQNEAAMKFLQSLKKRIDLTLEKSPTYKVIDETPREWWNEPSVEVVKSTGRIDIIESQAPNKSIFHNIGESIIGKQKREAESFRGSTQTEQLSQSLTGEDADDAPIRSSADKKARTVRFRSWFCLGMTTLLVLTILASQLLLLRKSKLAYQVKQVVARQHVSRYASGTDVRVIEQREVANGTEFTLEAGKHKFSVAVDDRGQVTAWRQTR